MIRLNDRLRVTEEQKTEITDMLFAYIKKLGEERDVTELSGTTIATWWLRQTVRPKWLESKIKEDAEFIGQICAFVDLYKDTIHRQSVGGHPLQIKETQEESAKTLLLGLSQAKGTLPQETDKSHASVLKQIDRLFYPNNQSDTLGAFPE